MPESKSDWPSTHERALKEYNRAYERERANIDEAYEDLKFRRGKVEDQWDAAALEARKGRPCHVINKLPQFVRQVTGDMRQMRPAIKVVPVDNGADLDTADVRGGIIRYVENRSYAKHVYTQAGDSQVTCGIGGWQVTTEYANSATFNQEIRIEAIEDGVAVLWDVDSVLPTREDAKHCFVPSDRNRETFKEEWPDAVASGFDLNIYGLGGSGAFSTWSTDDSIRLMTYWVKKPIKRTLALMPNGSIDDLTDQVSGFKKDEIAAAMEWLRVNKGARVEQRDSYKVCRYLLTLAEVLEERDWPGMHIPIVPLIGEEVRIGREVYRHGVVRYARDPQRMVNYYASAETETIALQPKAPWLGTKKQFQDSYDLWETANTENHPFLEYTPDDKAGGPPQRVAPPVASQAIQLGSQNAYQAMKEVIGIYDSGLGAKSNETSGRAIEKRQQEGDTGTFVYIDNFALAIQRTGQIINDLIPHIYDTERQMRIIGEDGKAKSVTINRPMVANGIDQVENDVTTGVYDVEMQLGPSYTTMREAAREALTQFIQAFPPAAPLVGDIYARMLDMPNAEQIGERLEEALPEPIKAKLRAEREDGKEPMAPTPQQAEQEQAKAQAQQMEQAAAALKMQELQAQAEKMRAEAEEARAKARKALAEAQKAEAEAELTNVVKAEAHMENLRRIEKHDFEMEDRVQARQHRQDGHEINMTNAGMNAARSAERHGAEMGRMARPQVEAE